jgi:L-2-hydroxyglutarate oxidase LhgO
MAFDCDTVVVGGGVIGIAVARALARAGDDVVIVEREDSPLHHTSSRNSEVIHAGLYYAADSWKARLCAPGRRALYQYLGERGLPHRCTGKLVVAVAADEAPALERVRAVAARNGVERMRWLDADALQRRAPGVRGVAALHVGVTGILDSHAFATAMLAEAEAAGASVAWRYGVDAIERDSDTGVAVHCRHADDGEATTVRARRMVNCAGHGAPRLYHATHGFGARRAYAGAFAKGNYAAVSGPAPPEALIYPVPSAHSLGVHTTVDLAGRVRLGPDLEWVESSDDYSVDWSLPERARVAAARYWPAVSERRVHPDYAGVRPKLRLDGELLHDFVLERDPDPEQGPWRALHCMGIESPGLTASLALAALVAGRPAEAGLDPAWSL